LVVASVPSGNIGTAPELSNDGASAAEWMAMKVAIAEGAAAVTAAPFTWQDRFWTLEPLLAGLESGHEGTVSFDPLDDGAETAADLMVNPWLQTGFGTLRMRALTALRVSLGAAGGLTSKGNLGMVMGLFLLGSWDMARGKASKVLPRLGARGLRSCQGGSIGRSTLQSRLWSSCENHS
jgi:hypothetical protein